MNSKLYKKINEGSIILLHFEDSICRINATYAKTISGGYMDMFFYNSLFDPIGINYCALNMVAYFQLKPNV
jgi:hypothetical protein